MKKISEKNWITFEIAIQYYKKAQKIRANKCQDIGKFRRLKEELMKQYEVTEIEAINILNGYHISDYVKKYEILSGRSGSLVDANKRKENRELILKIAQLEDELKRIAMENENI